MPFEIILGDITKAETTAIVNAANTSLLGGGGVDGAIHRAAGPGLLEECRELRGCKTGQAKMTKGYRLKAEYVIHTPGPKWYDGNHREAELLESCYRCCLELAMKHNINDISFPSISTGIFSFPLDKAAEIAVRTICQYPQMHITMVCFDENTKQAYEKAEAIYQACNSAAEVNIEYCNLPMRTAFENTELAAGVNEVLESIDNSMESLKYTQRTFRQLVCLDKGGGIPIAECDKILKLMEEQDKKAPYPLTKMYPCLLEKEWSLDMKDISYIKVDVRCKDKWMFCVERISRRCGSAPEDSFLYFFPYDSETGMEFQEADGKRYFRIQPDSERKLNEIMKSILLNGTVDLQTIIQ